MATLKNIKNRFSSLWSILQYFRPSLSYHLSIRPLFCLFLSGRLRQVLLYIFSVMEIGTSIGMIENGCMLTMIQCFRTFTVYLFSDGDWDFYWCDREWLHANYDTMFLQEHQKILHFRNHYEVSLSCADPEGGTGGLDPPW